jgi:hypothetical protein
MMIFRFLAVCAALFPATAGCLPVEKAELLLAWELTPEKLPPDMSIEGGKITVVAKTPGSPGDGAVIRAELVKGNRNEFEWRAPGLGTPYAYREGEELWVGFRLRVIEPGSNRSTSFFQIGPVRDGANRTRSIGHYQLMLRGEPKTAWTWREFAGWARGGGAVADERPRILNPEAPQQGYSTSIADFFPGREDSWVVQAKLHAAAKESEAPSEGLVRVWLNGRQVFERKGPNMLPGDYTRVKWGPYNGTEVAPSPIVADYTAPRIARGGGDDLGYLAVAPAEKITLEPGRPWRRRLDYPATARQARVTNLPPGWTFDAQKREIVGDGRPTLGGQRTLIDYLDDRGAVVLRHVWAFDLARANPAES